MPAVAQEVTPEPDEVPVIVVDDADEDYETIIGMVVVGSISIILVLVSGYQNGKFIEGAGRAIRIIRDDGIGDVVEARITQWSPERRRYANSILDVIDPYTDFKFTDLDDEVKAMLRDWFDGISEPPREVILEGNLSEAPH
jgi:hypothetical protein